MKKAELLSFLDMSLQTEEDATQVYFEKLQKIIKESNLEKEFIEQSSIAINKLIDGNNNHRDDCLRLIETIKNSVKEEF